MWETHIIKLWLSDLSGLRGIRDKTAGSWREWYLKHVTLYSISKECVVFYGCEIVATLSIYCFLQLSLNRIIKSQTNFLGPL